MFLKKLDITKRKVQIVLGVLWLLDGALQLQHQMFSSNFVTKVIEPASQGQPRMVTGLTHLAIRIFLTHPAVFNSFVAITQLGLGVLILWGRTAKLGLILSAIWGVFVWYIGEAAGGIFSGHTLILMGAPGAALIYAVLALGVMPTKKNAAKEEAKQPAYWLAFVWAALWIGGAVYQLLPGQNTTANISQMIYSNSVGAPDWLASLDTHVANVIYGFGVSRSVVSQMHMSATQMAGMSMSSTPIAQVASQPGYWFILLMAGVMVFEGLAVLLPGVWRKIAISLGIILSICFWFVGQSLGGYYSGVMTDPNSGLLFVILGVAILAVSRLDKKMLKIFNRLQKLLV